MPHYRKINRLAGNRVIFGMSFCRKYLEKALPKKRLKTINPVHSFRHSCAVHMLYRGDSVTDIKNHLGHENVQSSTVYLHLDLKRRRQIQDRFLKHMKSVLTDDGLSQLAT